MGASKEALRKDWLQKRLQLSEPQKNSLCFSIQERIIETFNLALIDHINIFLPANDKAEVRTWNYIQYIQEHYPQVIISVPRIKSMDTKEMEAIKIERQTTFSKNKWGINEPDFGSKADVSSIDLIYLPLLAFDQKGHRLGYGGGFYDRFLPSCTKALKVGLSYFEPVDIIPEINEFDVSMDKCITPDKVYKF